MFNKILEKPFRLISIVACLFLVTNIAMNIAFEFSLKDGIYPFSGIVIYVSDALAIIMFVLTFFINKRIFYYIGIELVVLSELYTGNIYTSLFFASILLVILLTERKIISKRQIAIYSSISVLKIIMVIPYGVTEFFYYIGLSLFALCTIGCINLLFRHAYSKTEITNLNISDYKLSDRQKNCIKEIVLNNTTIKALSIDYNVSESAIKKDLAHIYKVFGISGKADLKALFIGYDFEK